MRAFREAIAVGADGIECDVGLTKDLEPVIFHDTQLKRLCGIAGRLEDTSWKDLQKLKVFGQEPVPHLEELLEMSGSFSINLELKLTAKIDSLVQGVGQRLSQVKSLDRILISSFSAAILLQAKEQVSPRPKLALIFESFSELKFQKMKACAWIKQWNVRGSCLMQSGGPQDRPYWVWTLNEAADWKKVLESNYPVTAILSDHPDRLGQFLKTYSS